MRWAEGARHSHGDPDTLHEVRINLCGALHPIAGGRAILESASLGKIVDPELAATRRATTAKTLWQAAAGCIVLGLAVGSPDGSLALLAVAALFALPSVLLARGRARVLPALMLGVALYSLAVVYPAFREHRARWTERVRPVDGLQVP